MTTETTETRHQDESTRRESKPRKPRWLSGIRTRLLVSFVVVLALATAGSILVVGTILRARLDERIDDDLAQEAKELQRLSSGNDPESGEPFGGRVRRIFAVFLERNIPLRNEALLTFVDGRPYRSRQGVPYRLDADERLVGRWASLTESERGTVETPAGDVEFIAVPVRADGVTKGVFVAAIFRDLAAEEITPAVQGSLAVGIAVLIIGSLLAWTLSDRILAPVSRVTETAHSISAGDLRGRIEVSGNDEIAQLGATFNAMLDRLEDAFETQRRFIDDASHELRTPITIVQGQLEVLGDDPDDRRRTLAVVMDELDRMGRFVNDLLLLMRAERPDFLTRDPVDVQALTDEVFVKASALGDRRWMLDASGDGVVLADRQRLTQAVVALADNAVRHTSLRDEIGIGSAVGDGVARLWVRDTGPGIRPEDQKRIFDRFQRASGGRHKSDGAGLGLSIVRAIAHAHGGEVEVESAPAAGAVFTITLPLDGRLPGGRAE